MSKKARNPKVITVGNSYAVVIPRPLCRLLRFDRTTEINLSLRDDSIVIRAIGRADRTGQPDRSRLSRTIVILLNHYRMRPGDFERMSHDGTSWMRFISDVDVGGHVDLVTVSRIDECLSRRRQLERDKQTESWDETVDAVLLLIPATASNEITRGSGTSRDRAR